MYACMYVSVSFIHPDKNNLRDMYSIYVYMYVCMYVCMYVYTEMNELTSRWSLCAGTRGCPGPNHLRPPHPQIPRPTASPYCMYVCMCIYVCMYCICMHA